MEDITDVDCRHAKRVYEEFNNKNLNHYYDLCVQSDTLLLGDVLENFTNKYIKIHELDPARFLSAPRLAWQAALKKTKIELELLIDTDILLMVEKGIIGGICQTIHRCAKTNNKYMKGYDKKRIIMPTLFRCKQLVWMGNVSKIAFRWI